MLMHVIGLYFADVKVGAADSSLPVTAQVILNLNYYFFQTLLLKHLTGVNGMFIGSFA